MATEGVFGFSPAGLMKGLAGLGGQQSTSNGGGGSDERLLKLLLQQLMSAEGADFLKSLIGGSAGGFGGSTGVAGMMGGGSGVMMTPSAANLGGL